jgi:hypothetical protein
LSVVEAAQTQIEHVLQIIFWHSFQCSAGQYRLDDATNAILA